MWLFVCFFSVEFESFDFSFSLQFQLGVFRCVFFFCRFCNIVVLWLIPFEEFITYLFNTLGIYNLFEYVFLMFCLNSSADAVYFLVQSKVAVSFSIASLVLTRARGPQPPRPERLMTTMVMTITISFTIPIR